MTEMIDGEATEIVDEDGRSAGTEIVRRDEPRAVAVAGELSVEEMVGQVTKIKAVMEAAMTDGVHYGKIPGVDKPTLLKPGAEKLNLLFRMAPRYRITQTWHDDGHLTVDVVCELYHVTSGNFLGEGVGLCTTREKRYAFRKAGRECPECGKDAIIKGKAEYGGGWLCFGKKGGCGAKWPDSSDQATAFATAEVGQVPNEELPDTYNTVVKIAKKRAHVDATLTATAAGDLFTQDVEDTHGPSGEGSGTAAGDQPSDPSAATPDPEPSPEDLTEAHQTRVTRLHNLSKTLGVSEQTLEESISDHMAKTGLGFLDKPWVEQQIKRFDEALAVRAPDAAGAGAPAEEAA